MDHPSASFKNNDVVVNTDLFCTQLTYRIEKHIGGENRIRNCKYNVIDNCKGNKVVNVKSGSDTYKIHDGCLGKISEYLARMAECTEDIIIEDCFDPQIVNKALVFVLKQSDINLQQLSDKEKYDMVLFGARYGLPPKHMSKLIDRSIYADLVQYAWEKPNIYLMEILPKMRILDADIAKDFASVKEKTMHEFVSKYLEHGRHLTALRRVKFAIVVAIPIIWLILLLLAFVFDAPWEFPSANYQNDGRKNHPTWNAY